MGNTAEAVANEFNISREDQDEFALSHMKALNVCTKIVFKIKLFLLKHIKTILITMENEQQKATLSKKTCQQKALVWKH